MRRGTRVRARLVLTSAALAAAMAAAPAISAQIVLDHIVARVGPDIITLSDVRAVRALGLLPKSEDTDAKVLTALENRRLILTELARYPPPDPPPEAIVAKRGAWDAQAGAGTAQTFGKVGWTDQTLDSWLRDDLRIQAYLDRQFAAASNPLREEMLAYYQTHLADYTRDGVVQPFDQVQAAVRATLAARNRQARIAEWIASLRQRADIREQR